MAEKDIPAVDPELLSILVCPIGLSPLELEGGRLVCKRCGTRFPIEPGGVPNLLPESGELPAGVSAYTDLPCWGEREQAADDS